ncbi:hypothetical protein HMPREF9970_0030 [Lachnoanaerobaculum saburreum F0468]|uniref:Uncharacterized protein n=1 Tax=Lachnoanaerobaculum saburreum F0468 TaxID=1095750 RepID=I0RAW9_9FIRM|nr:hypothetical protein HMPREF9970_0030 [Lachnoanaerobaculum saburreum F0468]
MLCSGGRIAGAMKIGSYWEIPEYANKSTDKRIKNRKYIKNREEY